MTNPDTANVSDLLARTRVTILRLTAVFTAAIALTLLALAPAASAHSRTHATAYAASHTQGCANAQTPIGDASQPQLQAAVVCLVNIQRESRHLPALQTSSRLNRSAQGWTNVMVSHRLFSHGADFSARITAVGFDWSNVGENIATGYSTPASVVKGWMASTGHCQNILSPTYRDVGTGLSGRAITGTGDAPGTWTQDFGLIMGQHPASTNYAPADGCPYA
jgi:uncharacterized protein YkwD